MDFEYVNEYYGVNACIGREVTINGKHGVIAKDMGNYIGVLFDDNKPGDIRPCHPTWEVVYGGMIKVRQMTRSQRRYQRYLEISDCFDNFKQFLKWEQMPENRVI